MGHHINCKGLLMKKTLDQRGRVCESSGKFTEPRQKEVSGSFDSALDEFVAKVRWVHPLIVFEDKDGWSHTDHVVDFIKRSYPDLWVEVVKDPRVSCSWEEIQRRYQWVLTHGGSMFPEVRQPLSIKSISKQVETHQSAKRYSWWNT